MKISSEIEFVLIVGPSGECGNRLRVGVRAKIASVSGFACRHFFKANHSNRIHIFTPITRIVATTDSKPTVQVNVHM